MTADPPSLRVEIWSDIACPWCWIGKRNFERARAGLEDRVQVRWRSFELDRAAPRTPRGTLHEHLRAKYGTSAVQTAQMVGRVSAVGASVGLEFRFDRVQVVNTFDAHRMLHLASVHDVQDRLKERLFRAYMTEGRSVSDRDVLVEVGIEVGLPTEETTEMLASDRFGVEVRRDQADAAKLGVHGVPFFRLGGRRAIEGAQPVDRMRQVLEAALCELALDPSEVDPASGVCRPGVGCD